MVAQQFGEEIERVVRQVLDENGVTGAHVSLNDKGAVECVIRARVETAIRRGEGERTPNEKKHALYAGQQPRYAAQRRYPTGADAVILDLEDAVSPAEKDAARILVRNAIKTLHYKCEVCVRINSIDTPFWKEDLDASCP